MTVGRHVDWPFTDRPGTWLGAATCGLERPDGGSCRRPAGYRTCHPGRGHCGRHGGLSHWRVDRMGADVHEIAKELDISPWEALLVAVKRWSGMAAWYDSKIAETENDDDLRPGGGSYDWVKGSERAHSNAARYAKMAIDAGVAERMVQQMELEGQTIAQVLLRTLTALGLSAEQEETARQLLRRELLAVESGLGGGEPVRVIEGETR